jgi:hypothetical protein
VKARRGGQVDPQIPIPPDLFAKVTETIYPTICDAPHRASLHAYRLSNEYKGSETFAVQGRGYYMKGFSKRTTSRLSRSCPRAAISLSFSCGLAIPPFVSPLAFWNVMTPNTTIPTAESSNINMKTKMANSPSTMSLAS